MKRLQPTKRGDALVFGIDLTDEITGEALTGLASQLTAKIRDGYGVYYGSFVIEESGTPGSYVLTCADTKRWPAGEVLLTDIEFPGDGLPDSTETIQIPVLEDQTYG
jgi:hypothetical protein